MAAVFFAGVLNLYDVLRAHGHEVFLDQCVLKAGDPLIKNLEAGLTSSQTGVLVWSSATADSDWVFREYSTMEARTTKKPGFQFVPVRLDASELPSFATTRVFLDFSTYPDGPNGGELLRLLHAMVGQPLSPEAAHFANVQDVASKLAAAQIAAAIKQGRPDRLMQLFSDDGPPWQTSSALGCKAAEGLTRLGRNDEAIQMLDALEKDFPRAIRPKQLRALALARRAQRRRKAGDAAYEKDLMAAQDIVGVLYESGERDPETLGIYGRTWMDRYDVSGDLADLRQSRDLYAEAFEAAQDDYYTGINAASKNVLLGSPEELDKGAAYARRAQEIVGTSKHPNDYWKTATVAEAFLTQRDFAKAAELYDAAVAMAPKEVASHQTTWIQASRLLEKLAPSVEERALVQKPFEHVNR
jgi:tetratricopeptide (TPR) repeat protein